jgi:hypothetical protein
VREIRADAAGDLKTDALVQRVAREATDRVWVPAVISWLSPVEVDQDDGEADCEGGDEGSEDDDPDKLAA